MKKILLFAIIFIAVLSSVNATYYVTFNFDRNNVEGLAFACGDSSCNTVSSAFSWQGTSGNGEISIPFPDQQPTDKYALYFFSSGHIPIEGPIENIECFGPGDCSYEFTEVYDFQKADNCYVTIDSFSVTNMMYANEPATIEIPTFMDGTLWSPFMGNPTGVGYIPPNPYKNQYYAAETIVELDVSGPSGYSYSDSQTHFLVVDEYKDVQFVWIPQIDGQHTATVTTKVRDDKCSSYIDQNSQDAFNVNEERPQNECYTLLRNLESSHHPATVGDDITISYEKLSNHAGPNPGDANNLQPIQTQVTETITKSGQTFYSDTRTLSANSNAENYVEYGFDWTPTEAGTYTISVIGTCSSGQCSGLPNPAYTKTMTLQVEAAPPVPSNTVTFYVSNDNTGEAISGARVYFDGNYVDTNSNGRAVFNDVDDGTYSYQVTANGYESESFNVVVNGDETIYVDMEPTSSPAHQVNFYVADPSNNPISGAQIQMNGQTRTTNAGGIAVFSDVTDGNHDYTVSVNGYHSATDSVNVNGDEYVIVVLYPIVEGNDVTFNVEDPSGAPISGAQVNMRGQTRTTNSNGRVVFHDVSDNTYSYTVSATGYEAATGNVIVNGDETVDVVLNPISETNTVTFHVIDVYSNPIQGATVSFNGQSLTTDSNGQVIFNDISDNTYSYTVSAADYQDSTGSYVVNGNEHIYVVMYPIPETHPVTFHVTDNTGSAVSGAQVNMLGQTRITNSNGIAVFDDVSDNTYSYTVSAAGYQDATGSVVVDGDEHVYVILSPSTTVYDVTFHVTDNTGAPVSGAQVVMNGQTMATNSNGIAVFNNMGFGSYGYIVSAAGYQQATGTVDVVDQDVHEYVVLTPIVNQYDVTFHVNDNTGAPVVGALVQMNGQTSTTNTQGIAVFNNMDAGNYDYTVSATGYQDATGTVNVVNQDVHEYVVLTPLTGQYTVTFHVNDTSGIPIAGALVQMNGQDVYTNADGLAVFNNVDAGAHAYTVSATGYEVVNGLVDVDGDEDVFVVLAPIQGVFSVTFHVNDTSGVPIAGAQVDMNGQSVLTDAQGIAIFNNIPAGLYTYMIGAAGYQAATGNVIVDGDEDVFVILTPVTGTFSVTFHINDSIGPVQGASVQMDGQDILTDAQGISFFNNIAAGTYSYLVVAAGYQPVTGQVVVDEHEHVYITLGILNTCPVFGIIPDIDVNEDSGLNEDELDLDDYATDADGDTLSFSIVSQSNPGLVNCVIDGENNVDCTTILQNGVGQSVITVNVTDGQCTVQTTFNVTVHGENDGPQFRIIDDVHIDEDSGLNEDVISDLTNYVTDPDTLPDQLSFSIFSESNSMLVDCSIDVNDSVDCVTVLANAYGFSVVTVEVDDGQSIDRATFTVYVDPVNDYPHIGPLSDQDYDEDSNGHNDVIDLWSHTSDVDNPVNTLSFTIESQTNRNIVDCVIDSNRYVDCYVAPDRSGISYVTIRVSDGSLINQSTFMINVGEINDEPYFNSTPVISVLEGTVYTYDADAIDPEGQQITYSLDNAPAGMIINQNSGVITWNVPQNAAGNHTITVRATDASGAFATQTYTLEVRRTNIDPVIITTQITQTVEEQLYVYDVNATDADGDTLTYSLPTAPDGMAIDANSGVISWTPQVSGVYAVTVRVTDGFGGEDTQSFPLNVTNVNDDPIINSTQVVTAVVGELYEYDVEAYDEDGDTLTYSLPIGPAGMSILANSGLISWVPNSSQIEQHTVRVEVSDSKGGMDYQEYLVQVAADQLVAVTIVAEPNSGEIPLEVQFSAVITSGNAPFNYRWDLDGDGTIDSTDATPIYTYTESGTYTVTLYVTDADGDIGSDTEAISVMPEHENMPRRKVFIDTIMFIDQDYVKAGEALQAYVRFGNLGAYDMDEVSITIVIPELGLRKKLGPFQVDSSDEVSKHIFLDIPEHTSPGWYDVRVTISDDDIRRVRIRPIKII